MSFGNSILERVRKLNLIAICVILAMISSCVSQRRCIEKFPPVTTVDTVDNVIIIDTTIYVHLPADTVIDSIEVMVELDYVSDVVTVYSEYGMARAWIADSSLKIQLIMNDTLIAHRIDSLALVNERVITIEKEIVVEVKKIPPFYKAVLWIAVFLFVFILFLFFLSRK